MKSYTKQSDLRQIRQILLIISCLIAVLIRTCSIGCGGLAPHKELGQPWHRVAPRYNIQNILEIANSLLSACVKDSQLILPSGLAGFASSSVADLPLDHPFPHSYLGTVVM